MEKKRRKIENNSMGSKIKKDIWFFFIIFRIGGNYFLIGEEQEVSIWKMRGRNSQT